MRSSINFNQLSRHQLALLGIILSISLLVDAKLFFVYLVQDKTLGYILFGIYTISLIFSCGYFLLNFSFSMKFWLIFNFCLLGLGLDLYRGLDLGSSILQANAFLCLPIGYVLYRNNYFTLNKITKTLLFFSGLHLFFIFFSLNNPYLLNSFTGYGDSIYLGKRAVGIFSAPGVLSFYAILVFAYSFAVYRMNSSIINLFLSLFGFILGLLSGNRSFVISFSIVFLVLLFWQPKLPAGIRTIPIYFKLLTIILVSVYLINTQFVEQISLVHDRFGYAKFDEDYQTRLRGSVGLIPSLLSITENPLIGNVVFDQRRKLLAVSYNNNTYSISNGYVSIIGYYGIPLGLMFYYVFLFAFRRLRWFSKSLITSESNAMMAAFFFMMLGGSIVCMGDAFLKSPMMMTLMILPFVNKD